MTSNTWSNFEKWVLSRDGRIAMNSDDLTGCPECEVCGDITNDEMDIRSNWEGCVICDKWICCGRSYCSNECRTKGRSKKKTKTKK